MGADFFIVLRWWGALFLVGTVAYPLTSVLFGKRWFDRGYLFAKAVGMAFATYLVYIFGIFHVLPFAQLSIYAALGIIFVFGLWLKVISDLPVQAKKQKAISKIKHLSLLIFEEAFFFWALLFWSWIKGHEPSIHGLEKFMDFGFTQSILNSAYFPAPDMWYAGSSINYYYFGHTVMAFLTKLSGLDLGYTFNLMLASIFAFTLTMSFSIAYHVIGTIEHVGKKLKFLGALLTSYILTLGGNLQTLYAFTKGYTGENVQPFWKLYWPFAEFWQKLPEGLERYWYANATRFIPYTIHEFPSYSFVVSDVHGHVLSIPFVLLAIALLIVMFGTQRIKQDTEILRYKDTKKKSIFVILVSQYLNIFFYGLLVAILLMTNALDGPIYLGLFLVLYGVTNWTQLTNWSNWIKPLVVVGVAIVASIPFMMHFNSFVSGMAVNCPIKPLANIKIGPLLFEGVEKCQHSPIWMMALLWGFFVYCGIWLLIRIFNKTKKFSMSMKYTQTELVLVVLFFVSVALIIFPEFFYFKDIYPMHFRSNTMFKLGYQAFMMFSLVAGYTIVKMMIRDTQHVTRQNNNISRILFFVFLIPQLFLVMSYPIFSVRSYFDSLRTYKGLYGLTWMMEQYPDDYEGIIWLKTEIKQQGGPSIALGTTMEGLPSIVEADGDSYTDYARYSAFTGIPSVIGWPVHEWLWRGTYDIVAPRREEVRKIYESDDVDETQSILNKYNIQYIIVGTLEREKYKMLREDKIEMMCERVFARGETKIYRVNSKTIDNR